MDEIVLRPFMGIPGEFSVILAGNSGELRSIEVIAEDEFAAVTLALEETGWNILGEITVDDENTIVNNLEPLLSFVYQTV